MKKNIAELQARMKERLQNEAVLSVVESNVCNTDAAQTTPVEKSAVTIQQSLCSHCQRRVCRRGSTLCSRCTGKTIQQELRSVLPGMEVKKEELPLRQTNWKAKRAPNSDYIYAGVQEGMRAATSTPEYVDQEHTGSFALTPGVKVYTRREVATLLGVSPTSICRWEQKGKTPPPVKIVRTGQLIYTEEHLTKLKEFMSQVVIVHHEPKLVSTEGQQEVAAKITTKKVFKLHKGIERVVASRLGRMSGLGKLI